MAMITWHQAGPDGIERQFFIEAQVRPGSLGRIDCHPDAAVAPDGAVVEDMTISGMAGRVNPCDWPGLGFDDEILEHVRMALVEESHRMHA